MQELIYSQIFLPAIEQHGESDAIIDGDYRSNWREHSERVSLLCHGLAHQLGVVPSDRFAVLALNSHEYLELWHSAFMGAGIINPLNLRLAPKELAYIIEDSGTSIVFVDATFAPLVAAARQHMSADPIRQVVLIGEGDAPCDLSYEALLSAASPIFPEAPQEQDPVVLMYTGGTTGLPKGVLIEHRAQMLNLYHGVMTIPGLEIETFLLQTPMFHAASMIGILGIPMYGGRVVFIPMFVPDGVLQLCEAHSVTHTMMVPTMVGLCMACESYAPERLASLKQLIYGASPMPTATLTRLLKDLPGIELVQGYGMTEACSTVSLLLAEDHKPGSTYLGSVGKPSLGTRISIQDSDDNELPRGEIGEVCIKGGQIMREYWNKPDATAEALRGGWYHSGDAGYVDPQGYLFLVDRVKDMIVTGGENVYSAEVESAISTHPDVAQVAVIGIPDEKWGEAVHAVVVPMPGVVITIDAIIEHARDSIAGYKIPKSVEFRIEALPLSGAMKVLKKELREPYWKGKDKGIG
ncbi:MAG: long-chain acyl-CoA synthetase [Candidatus Azotimanducaceae bacterium]|jgi:long-chain acyl-CoA synthetase